MISEIGEAAGKVYIALEVKGEMTLAGLKTTIKADAFLTDAAIGWLAREDKLNIVKSGKTIRISLR
ncbi:MAG: winged helix-turn-helix domain-containing protein [Calditrichaceae bacterium]|nr:winged helix-turn-helix domain-containing protein [Calditrichaceae bacterium]MBN2710477.1 winged helix-turn-helix domain-containing protein [Calditrichaceae bacterium]RQV97268.1 MAG: hypothetical protein EH224_01620 [Calditrichota bacterium]